MRVAKAISVLGVALLLVSCRGQKPPDPTPSTKAADVFGQEVSARQKGSFGLDRGTEVNVAAPVSGKVLRVTYPRGSVSPSATRSYGAPGGGMQTYLPSRKGPLDEAYLRYYVRFPAGFEFVKGGKLPGLWGGEKVSGGAEPDGTNGFSTRLMWRAEGAGEVYLYAPKNSGTSLGRGDWTWPTEAWTCVEQHVRLNDPSKYNGSVTTWLNGRTVYEKTNILYRTVDTLMIEGIFFSTFFGGADRTWASPKDQYADFAGFRLSAQRPGCAN